MAGRSSLDGALCLPSCSSPSLSLSLPHSLSLSLPDMAAMNLNNGSSGASDQDTLGPLPHPSAPWPLGQGYPYQYPLAPPCFPPAYQDPGFSYGSGSAGSQHSEGRPSGASFCLPASLALLRIPPSPALALPASSHAPLRPSCTQPDS